MRKKELITWIHKKTEGRGLTEKTYRQYRNRIRRRLKKATLKRDADKLGEDFVLYRAASKARTSGRYETAIEKYSTIIDEFDPDKSAFVAPARLYRAVAKLKGGKGDVEEAKKELYQFYKDNRWGRFRGESLAWLARIAMEIQLNPENGMRWVRKLDEWIKKIRNKPDLETLQLAKEEEAAKKIAPPKKRYRSNRNNPAKFGGVSINQAEPGQLTNRFTADWYLDELESRAAKNRGFLLQYYFGEKKKAKKQYDRLTNLSLGTTSTGFSVTGDDHRKLLFMLRKGCLYAPPEELKVYNDKLKYYTVMLMDYLYVTRNFKRARAVATRFLDGKAGRLSRKERGYPHIMLGSTAYRLKGESEAFKYYNEVIEGQLGTEFTIERALYAAANMSIKSGKKELAKKGWNYWNQLIRNGESRYALKGIIGYAIHLNNAGQQKKAVKLLDKFPTVDHPMKDVANSLRKRFQEKIDGKDS